MGLGIFIAAVVVVSIISLCFLKKKFWENRYLVLFISGCVALVATLTTNFATRGNLDTDVKTIWEMPLQVMNLDSACVDSSAFTTNKKLSFNGHLHAGDSLAVSKYSRHLFFYGDGGLRVGFASDNDTKSRDWDNVYFAQSTADTIAYAKKLRLRYAKRNSKWVADFSLPQIKTIKCLYLPPAEYAMIPDSLIRNLPF